MAQTTANEDLLCLNLQGQVRVRLESLDEPTEHLGHQPKVGLAEVLERDEAWVAQRPHHLCQAPQVPVRHFGNFSTLVEP